MNVKALQSQLRQFRDERDWLDGVPEVLFPLPGHVRRETVVETLRDYVDAALEEKP